MTPPYAATTNDDPLGQIAADYEENYVAMDEQVALRVMHWTPHHPQPAPTLLFVAGWVSVIQGWAQLMRRLVVRQPVYYLETREKRSARIQQKQLSAHDFSIERSAFDLLQISHHLSLDPAQCVLAGSSLGATTVLEACKDGRLQAQGAFLIGPNTEFRFPWWGHLIVRLPAATYHLLKYLILWYLRNFRVDAAREPEQMQRYEQTLLTAHPQRIKLSAQAVRHYQIWPNLETVRIPVAIAYSATDTLHGEENIQRMVTALPQARSLRFDSNKYMHSAAIADDLFRFLETLAS